VHTEAALAKARLRAHVLARRGELTAPELATAARLLADTVLGAPEVAAARCVAAYVSVGAEPGTRHLLDALAERGTLVLAPVLLADGDLDWADYTGAGDLVPAPHGLLEPPGPRLGVDAITRADVVLVPALAVDHAGRRLGRGGGSYDRALARVVRQRGSSTARIVCCALLHDGELLAPGDDVPAEPHDIGVGAVAMPSGYLRLPS
jgi:5-formyltetrahydrofolate cyclo-ligase